MAPKVDTFAPRYAIEVAGQLIDMNVRQYVTRVEYESVDGIADMGKVTCLNPMDIIANSRVFQPGNEMSLFMGYGLDAALAHIGRVHIVKQTPSYPENGPRTLTVTGYTLDTKMMDNSPEKSKGGKVGKGKKKKQAEGRRYKDSKYSDAVRTKAKEYGMLEDINRSPDEPRNFMQKVGMSDYEFVIGLANELGWLFWVDGDEFGNWTLHFRDPLTIAEQDKKYTFKYDMGDQSSLLSFRPELLIRGGKTKIKAVFKDVLTGKVTEVEQEEDNDKAPEMSAEGDPVAEVDGPYTSASDVKLYFGDYSFDVSTNKTFRNEAEAKAWITQWFRRERENFVLCSGTTIGVEDLMARQTHAVEGIAKSYVGDYYFSKVRHVMNNSGYKCTMNGRRLVP